MQECDGKDVLLGGEGKRGSGSLGSLQPWGNAKMLAQNIGKEANVVGLEHERVMSNSHDVIQDGKLLSFQLRLSSQRKDSSQDGTNKCGFVANFRTPGCSKVAQTSLLLISSPC